RQLHGLVPDLLQRARRLELDLALGALDDVIGFGARLLPDLLTEPVAVGPALRDDRVGLHARPRDYLRRLRVQSLHLLLRQPGVVQRLLDRLLARLECLQQRTPGKLRQQRQQDEERQNRPDEQPGIGLEKRVIHGYFNTISSTPTSA